MLEPTLFKQPLHRSRKASAPVHDRHAQFLAPSQVHITHNRTNKTGRSRLVDPDPLLARLPAVWAATQLALAMQLISIHVTQPQPQPQHHVMAGHQQHVSPPLRAGNAQLGPFCSTIWWRCCCWSWHSPRRSCCSTLPRPRLCVCVLLLRGGWLSLVCSANSPSGCLAICTRRPCCCCCIVLGC